MSDFTRKSKYYNHNTGKSEWSSPSTGGSPDHKFSTDIFNKGLAGAATMGLSKSQASLVNMSLAMGFASRAQTKVGDIAFVPTKQSAAPGKKGNDSFFSSKAKPNNASSDIGMFSSTGWPVLYSQMENGSVISAFVLPGMVSRAQLGPLDEDNEDILIDPGEVLTKKQSNDLYGEDYGDYMEAPEAAAAPPDPKIAAEKLANNNAYQQAMLSNKRRRTAQTSASTFMGSTLGDTYG